MDIGTILNLPEAEFRKQIVKFINNAVKTGKTLPLPFHIKDSNIEVMTLFLSQLNCSACRTVCCLSSKYAKGGVPLLDNDYAVLVKRIGAGKLDKMGIKSIDNKTFIHLPCPFLDKNKCSIYDIRPTACMHYPFDQPGEDNLGRKMISLDPLCPEARRITRRLYLTYRDLYNNKQWESVQCPYPDCKAPLRWHPFWEEATCTQCGRPIARQKLQG
jgi:Fe-S-cluster containining protein